MPGRVTHLSLVCSNSSQSPVVPIWTERVEVEGISQVNYEIEDQGRQTRESTPALPPVASFANPSYLSQGYGSYTGPERLGGSEAIRPSNLHSQNPYRRPDLIVVTTVVAPGHHPTRPPPPPPIDPLDVEGSDPEPDWNVPEVRKRYLRNIVNPQIVKAFKTGNPPARTSEAHLPPKRVLSQGLHRNTS